MHALVDGDLHLRIKKAQGIAPLRLHLVHGNVGLLEQVHRRLHVLPNQGGANAGGAVVGVGVQQIGHVEAAQNLLAHPARQRSCLFAVGGQVLEHDHKLIAPKPRHRVFGAHAGLQALRHLLQQ